MANVVHIDDERAALARLLDPSILEARLADARQRRSAALAARAAANPGPAPTSGARGPLDARRLPPGTALIAFAFALVAVGGLVLGLRPAPDALAITEVAVPPVLPSVPAPLSVQSVGPVAPGIADAPSSPDLAAPVLAPMPRPSRPAPAAPARAARSQPAAAPALARAAVMLSRSPAAAETIARELKRAGRDLNRAARTGRGDAVVRSLRRSAGTVLTGGNRHGHRRR